MAISSLFQKLTRLFLGWGTAFSQLSRKTFRFLVLYPLSLLALQSFELLSEALLSYSELAETWSYAFAIVVFPVVWYMSFFATAATFEFLRQSEQGKPSLRATFAAVAAKWKPLLLAGFVAGFVVILGLIIILPGIFFLSVYLFVPCYVMLEAPTSAFTYLAQSSALTRPRRLEMLVLATAIVLLSVGLDELQNIWTSDSQGWFARVAPRLFFALAMSAVSNSFIVACFLQFQQDPGTSR